MVQSKPLYQYEFFFASQISMNYFRKRARVGGDKFLSKTTTEGTTREAGKQPTSRRIRDRSVLPFSEDL